MTKVNTCLKLVFTIFNIFFAIIGALIIGLALLCQVVISRHVGAQVQGAVIILYVVGGITMVIAILGAYGAHRESRVSLIIFLVCMVTSTLIMLKAGVLYGVICPQIEKTLDEKFRSFIPLDKASPEDQNVTNTVQSQLHCCGLFSYTDWNSNIPDSCLCSQEEGECQIVDSAPFQRSKSIYAEPCFPIILHYTKLVLNIVLGVTFSLLVLALLGMILSSIIIHQLRYPTRPMVNMMVPPIFTTAPPKYQELINPQSY